MFRRFHNTCHSFRCVPLRRCSAVPSANTPPAAEQQEVVGSLDAFLGFCTYFSLGWGFGQGLTRIIRVHRVEGPSMEPTLFTGDVILGVDVPMWFTFHRIRDRLLAGFVRAPNQAAGCGAADWPMDDNWENQRLLTHRIVCAQSEGPHHIICKRVANLFQAESESEDDSGPPSRERKDKAVTSRQWFATLWGDNAPRSHDSRHFGPVPLGGVNAVVFACVWPLSRAQWLEAKR